MMKVFAICIVVAATVFSPSGADAQARRQRGMMRGPDRGPAVGEKAPDFSLTVLNSDTSVTLSDLYREKPVVLTLGSYTCPPFRRALEGVEELYQQYSNTFTFCFVYIKEAHAADERPSRANERQGIRLAQPTTYEERSEIALTCREAVNLTMPILVDALTNEVERKYAAAPNRTYLIARDGTILYRGVRGPRGTRPDEIREALISLKGD